SLWIRMLERGPQYWLRNASAGVATRSSSIPAMWIPPLSDGRKSPNEKRSIRRVTHLLFCEIRGELHHEPALKRGRGRLRAPAEEGPLEEGSKRQASPASSRAPVECARVDRQLAAAEDQNHRKWRVTPRHQAGGHSSTALAQGT